MRVLRLAMPSQQGYIMCNNYFYRVIDQGWSPVSQGISIHDCVAFLANLLDDFRYALSTDVSEERLTELVNCHFPALLNYVALEYETIGFEIPATHFHRFTRLDLTWFSRAISFYKVKILYPWKHNLWSYHTYLQWYSCVFP